MNLQPARLMPGVPCPLAGRKVGDIDFYLVRGNAEGEYSAVGGRLFEGTERETVLQESIFIRNGVDHILNAIEAVLVDGPRTPDLGGRAATAEVGAAIAANKLPGIRAGLCHDTYSAAQGVLHDDTNVLVLGARVIGPALAEALVTAFLGARFTNAERHVRRLAKVKALEQKALQQIPTGKIS